MLNCRYQIKWGNTFCPTPRGLSNGRQFVPAVSCSQFRSLLPQKLPEREPPNLADDSTPCIFSSSPLIFFSSSLHLVSHSGWQLRQIDLQVILNLYQSFPSFTLSAIVIIPCWTSPGPSPSCPRSSNSPSPSSTSSPPVRWLVSLRYAKNLQFIPKFNGLVQADLSPWGAVSHAIANQYPRTAPDLDDVRANSFPLRSQPFPYNLTRRLIPEAIDIDYGILAGTHWTSSRLECKHDPQSLYRKASPESLRSD